MTRLEKLKQDIRKLGPEDFTIFHDWFLEYVAVTLEETPIHEWQKEELDRRKANFERNPDSGVEWEEVKQRVSGHKSDRPLR